MMRGRRPPGITDSVENCGTELNEDSGAVVSAGIPVEVTGSGIIELGDNSGTVVSAGVSMEVTGSADRLSLV